MIEEMTQEEMVNIRKAITLQLSYYQEVTQRLERRKAELTKMIGDEQ